MNRSKKPGPHFCWRIEGSEHAYGPHDSIEKVLAEARHDCDDEEPVTIIISPVVWIEPQNFVDADDIIERMREAFDDRYSYDDDPFELIAGDDHGATAKRELAEWAAKHVNADCKWVWGDPDVHHNLREPLRYVIRSQRVAEGVVPSVDYFHEVAPHDEDTLQRLQADGVRVKPGAGCLNWTVHVDEAARFKDAEEAAELLASIANLEDRSDQWRRVATLVDEVTAQIDAQSAEMRRKSTVTNDVTVDG